MQKSLLVWKFIANSLQEKIPVMLLYVVESNGSSPGRQGFFMAVNKTGEMQGSIGGGIMEHKFVELAKEQLKNTEPGTRNDEPGSIRKQVHDKSAATDQSGMICSGEQTILLLSLSVKDMTTVDNIISSLQAFKNGTLEISPGGLSFSTTIPVADYAYHFESPQQWLYKEKTGYKNHLYIIGGGHCALAFSRLMQGMDFYITLYEERQGLNTVVQNDFVHEIILVEDYTALGYHIASGRNQYVVIMTFGYRTDDIALRSLLDKSFTYIGVLGSKQKMEKLFAEYKAEGINEAILKNIHSPIGIAIKSQTPEEIAVSIAAEIIKVKNG